MALTLLIAGSYAAYVAKQNAEAEATCAYDESIQLDGKTKIKLLSGGTAGLMEIPLTCINWFSGDYTTVVDGLEQRIEEILEKNPFLKGWLILDKEEDRALTLVFDKTGDDSQKGFYRVFDHGDNGDATGSDGDSATASKPTSTGISSDTSYEESTRILTYLGAMLPLQHDVIGKDNQPLFRVSILPDVQNPNEKFALVVSMAHALGDSHTFYKLVSMMDIADGYAQQLIVERDATVAALTRQKMGNEALDYLATAVKKPPMDLTSNRDEPTVMKAFHVKEEWFPTKDKRARRASLFNEVATDTHIGRGSAASSKNKDKISENSILASWFFNLAAPDIAFMGLSVRDRLHDEGCIVSDLHAGNYVAGIPYTPMDYATPALIEQSVATLKRCGHSVTVVPSNTSTIGDDAGTTAASTTPPAAPPPTISELPAFRWNNSASISLNWAHRFQDKLQLSEATEHLSHMVLFDSVLLKDVPGRLSLCYMFTSVPGDKQKPKAPSSAATSMAESAAMVAQLMEEVEAQEAEAAAAEDGNGSNTRRKPVKLELHGKRAGVLVVCRQSVWEHIKESGIIDEMIVDA